MHTQTHSLSVVMVFVVGLFVLLGVVLSSTNGPDYVITTTVPTSSTVVRTTTTISSTTTSSVYTSVTYNNKADLMPSLQRVWDQSPSDLRDSFCFSWSEDSNVVLGSFVGSYPMFNRNEVSSFFNRVCS